MLELRSVSVRFGGLFALSDVSFRVEEGTIHALIGPNGAGKTTLFNVVSGVQKPTSGDVLLAGASLAGVPLHRRASYAMARTFQNIRLFDGMDVLENVMCGAHPRMDADPLLSVLGIGRGRREEVECRRRCLDLLGSLGLETFAHARATSLPYGHQRRVEIARALASGPRLLLLDEPAAGMNPTETRELVGLLRKLKAEGLTIVVVEHDLHFLMNLSDRMTVIDFGRVLTEGSPSEVRTDPRVIEAYLGSVGADRMKAIA